MSDTPTPVTDYDAGFLNDYGGGDVTWWHDYLRAEIGRANEYWRKIHEQELAATQRKKDMLRDEAIKYIRLWEKATMELETLKFGKVTP